MVSTPFPVTKYIAPGANPADPSTFNWTEITSDVRYAEGIQIQAGRPDEGSKVDTGSHSATLDARSGNYSRRNPLGAYFGQLRSGTPSQTRMTLIDDLFARTVSGGFGTDSVSGQAWTSSSAFSVNGSNGLVTLASANTATATELLTVRGDDVDLYKVTSLSAVATGAPWVDATMVRWSDGNNFYRVHTEYGTGGVISVKVTRFAASVLTDILTTVATAVSYSAGTKIATRIQAIGATFRIKVWLASGSEPAAWTASVDDANTMARGNAVGLYQWRVVGNTNAGSLVCSIYEYRVDSIRATTPVPEWPTRWNQTGTYSTAPIVGAGILRRLSQGQSALRSPMYRLTTGYANLIGYWPMEDGSNATQLANAVPGGQPGSLLNMSLGATGPAGSAGAATFTNSDPTSKVSGGFKGASTTAGWQMSWSTKLAALPTSTTQMIAWFTSNGYTWAINLASGSYTVSVVDSTGTSLVSAPVSNVGAGDPNQWVTFRMRVTVSGGTVTWAFAWFAQGAGNVFGSSGTFSGTAGALKSWTANGNASMGNGNICHVFGLTTGDDNLQSFAALRAFDGYAGETAGNRAIRLAADEGVPLLVMGDPDETAPMGPQTAQAFLDLIRECEDADQAVLVERGAGLGLLTYGFRINVPVTLALDFNSGHVIVPPEPTDDDQGLINSVTLTRTGGSSVTVDDDDSIALSGTYSTDLTINLQTDSQLDDQAGWRLHMGTVDELRWPQISLSLHGTPSLIPTWCAMRIGSRITIANPPDEVAGAQLDLILEGYTETITPLTWDVVMNCSPATPWDVGIYSDSATRYDSTLTTLASGITSSATSVPITTAASGTVAQDTWSTTAVPYTWVVGGEQMTVTAITSPSGTGPFTQTATVTRAVNGIAKAHVTGEQVSLATPKRYALPV